MLGRHRIETSAPIRSSLANAAFAVEERLVWGGVDVLRQAVEAARWPFERLIWAVERGLVWPLEERTGKWGPSGRTLGVVSLALVAAGAGVLGLVLASNGGGSTNSALKAAVPPPAAPTAPAAKVEATAPATVLQGARPDFAAEADGGVAKSSSEPPPPGGSSATANSTAELARSTPSTSGTASAGDGKVAGPAAIAVARQFSNAFVLYEIGRESANVRRTFNETATPQLTRALLRRPPRQPAGTEVPRAKVLNVVPGPHHGDTYTLSVSLLRVGVTSELRLDMQRDPKTGKWQVTDSLG